MRQTAVVLASGLLRTPFAKTAHGLLRGPCRYHIVGVVDPDHAGLDAGEILDGVRRELPIEASLAALIERHGDLPEVCIVGVATVGGVLPTAIRQSLLEAADLGATLVNGLHQLLSDDAEIADRVARAGGKIIDIRRPRPVAELRFWTGEVLDLATPRIAVLGTDCAVGKRTTALLLRDACRRRGWRAEMIYTGQTGWLQGMAHGFILDATPNDFVCGELEGAILACARELEPEVILLEGQSGLRNPAGPCGSELLLAAGAHGAILQHAPGRLHYEDLAAVGCRIPPVAEEIELIRLLGVEVWALTLNDENLPAAARPQVRDRLAQELGIPVLFPLHEGVDRLVDLIATRLKGPSKP